MPRGNPTPSRDNPVLQGVLRLVRIELEGAVREVLSSMVTVSSPPSVLEVF